MIEFCSYKLQICRFSWRWWCRFWHFVSLKLSILILEEVRYSINFLIKNCTLSCLDSRKREFSNDFREPLLHRWNFVLDDFSVQILHKQLKVKMLDEHFDCLIIGAGICGIGKLWNYFTFYITYLKMSWILFLDAAYYMQKNCPWAKYAILESRSNLGGTWDLFKYPG